MLPLLLLVISFLYFLHSLWFYISSSIRHPYLSSFYTSMFLFLLFVILFLYFFHFRWCHTFKHLVILSSHCSIPPPYFCLSNRRRKKKKKQLKLVYLVSWRGEGSGGGDFGDVISPSSVQASGVVCRVCSAARPCLPVWVGRGWCGRPCVFRVGGWMDEWVSAWVDARWGIIGRGR